AADILATLRRDDAGGASLVITQAAPSATPAVPVLATPSTPHGSGPIPANELVRAPDGLAEAAAELLCDVVVTADLEQARRYVRDNPGFKAVTRDGDLLGAYWAQGGGARPQSLLEMRAAAAQAAAGPAEA